MTCKINQGFARNSILLLLILGVSGITASVLAGYLVRQPQSMPQQDSPALLAYPQPGVIADFALFDPDFIAATSEHKQLQALSHQLGAAYKIQQHDEGANEYAVGHTAGIFLLNPQARLHGQFHAPHRARLIAAELKQLILAARTN